MKYLIVLLLVALVAWQWRKARAARQQAGARPASPQVPQDMVVCAHCGVHVPTNDAVSGNAGQYCDSRHRTAAER